MLEITTSPGLTLQDLLVKVEISIYISSSQTAHMAVMGGSQSPDFFKK